MLGALDVFVEALLALLSGALLERELEREAGWTTTTSSGTVGAGLRVSRITAVSEQPALHAGDSTEQRRAEGLMLDVLEAQLGLRLERPLRLSAGGSARMEIDGGIADDGAGRALLVEAWAHQGPPKAAQKKKIVADALKLAYAGTLFETAPRLILLFSDEQAAAPFGSPKAWSSAAFRTFGIEMVVVDLPADERAVIRAAQDRQYR